MNIATNKNIILIGICGFLAITTILVTIQTAATGLEMKNLINEESSLRSSQKSMEEDYAKNLSVTNLQKKSAELGFGLPQNLVYVVKTAQVANLP